MFAHPLAHTMNIIIKKLLGTFRKMGSSGQGPRGTLPQVSRPDPFRACPVRSARAAHRRQTAHRTSAPETQAFAHPNWRVLQTGCPCLHVTQTGCPCLQVLQNRYPCLKIFVAHVCTWRPINHQKQQNDRTTIQQNPETKKNTKTQENKQKHGYPCLQTLKTRYPCLRINARHVYQVGYEDNKR